MELSCEQNNQISEEESYIKLAYAVIGQAIQDSQINEIHEKTKHEKYKNKKAKSYEKVKDNYKKEGKEEVIAKNDADEWLAGTTWITFHADQLLDKNVSNEAKEKIKNRLSMGGIRGLQFEELLANICEGSEKSPEEIKEILLQKAKILNPIKID